MKKETLLDVYNTKNLDIANGSLSSLVEYLISNPDLDYKTVYIDLWSDDTTIKSIFGGIKECNHKYINEDNNLCKCGAWVGNIGEEQDVCLYYKHLFNLYNNIDVDEIFIRLDRYYPIDFNFSLFGLEVKKLYRYAKIYVIYNNALRFNSRNDIANKCNYFFLLHLSKKKKYLWKNEILLNKSFNPIYLFKGKTLFVNPYYDDISLHNIDYYICNTDVLKYLHK